MLFLQAASLTGDYLEEAGCRPLLLEFTSQIIPHKGYSSINTLKVWKIYPGQNYNAGSSLKKKKTSSLS